MAGADRALCGLCAGRMDRPRAAPGVPRRGRRVLPHARHAPQRPRALRHLGRRLGARALRDHLDRSAAALHPRALPAAPRAPVDRAGRADTRADDRPAAHARLDQPSRRLRARPRAHRDLHRRGGPHAAKRNGVRRGRRALISLYLRGPRVAGPRRGSRRERRDRFAGSGRVALSHRRARRARGDARQPPQRIRLGRVPHLARPRASGLHRRSPLRVPSRRPHRLRGDGVRPSDVARRAGPTRHRPGPSAPGPAARRGPEGGRLARSRRGRSRDPSRAPAMRLGVPLALGGVFAFLASRAPVSDSDLFWHLALGREIATSGLPRVDSFSWTIAGGPILVDQWLGELLIYWSYAIGSWSGIVTLRAVAVGAIAALVVASGLAERPGRPLVAVLAALPAIALSRFAWTDRPELLGLLCFATCVALLGAARRGSARALAATIPLLMVWANVHGSYALGLGIVVLALLARALSDPSERLRSLVALSAQRHLVFFPIAAAPYLAARAPEVFARVAALRPEMLWRVRRGTEPAPRTVDLAGLVIALGLVLVGATTAPREPDLSAFPNGALAALPGGSGLLNRYDWGGFLIWYPPATPRYVDGRLFPYAGAP